jgi:hypothetical protein
MLLIFPNTFEFFFIAYELIRLRYAPAKLSTRFWVGLAAGLWVCVKLPQEYWIHIAQRDFTDTVSDNPVIGVAAALLIGALLAVLRWVVQPRLRAPDHDGLRLRADEATVVTERSSASGIPSMLEKIVLLALLCTIFAEILPRVDWSPLQVTVGIIVVVCANAAIGVRTAWGARLGVDSTAARVTALLAANLALVLATRIILLPGLQSVQLRAALFFALLITVIIGLYDTYRPVFERRFAG